MLKDIFINVIYKYTSDEAVIDKLWADIENAYQKSNRSYHNLDHLETIVCDLDKCRSYINDWDVVIFSTCYHDVVYNTLKTIMRSLALLTQDENYPWQTCRQLKLKSVPPK